MKGKSCRSLDAEDISHRILTCPNAKRAVVIPEYDGIDVEIIKNNMRTVGMTREQYFELINKE